MDGGLKKKEQDGARIVTPPSVVFTFIVIRHVTRHHIRFPSMVIAASGDQFAQSRAVARHYRR